MNDDTAEIEANVDNAYQAGIRDGRKMERERIAVAIEAMESFSRGKTEAANAYRVGYRTACLGAARIARTEPS